MAKTNGFDSIDTATTQRGVHRMFAHIGFPVPTSPTFLSRGLLNLNLKTASLNPLYIGNIHDFPKD